MANISYNKLFEFLDKNGIKKTEMMSALHISSRTMAKMAKNETVSMNVIIDICKYLHCTPNDVFETVDDPKEDMLLNVLLEEKNHKIKGGLYHQTQIQMAYNSNHIEGSTLSEEQTRAIFETNTIGLENTVSKVDDIIEAVNHFTCFDYILDNARGMITESFIKEVHRILKSGTSDSRLAWFNVGDYKQRPNSVGGNDTTDPENVSTEMKKLLSEYNKIGIKTIDDIIDFHVKFESIHPFQDGNGRVGRLLMFKECLKYRLIPFIVYDSKKLFYYRGIKEYHNDKAYITDTIKSFQDEYENLLKYFRITAL